MSLQALARTLGLSVSTVSRALNGYSDVSAATRARVEAAAQAMNYRPHPVAHRLATGRTGAVALITSVRGGNFLDASFAALQSGVAEVLRPQGYFALSVALPAGEPEMPELERFLAGRLVDGVILARTRTTDPRVALLQERGLPFVTHGRTEHNAPHAWVDTDNERAFHTLTRRLLALGHRRLAFINGLPHMTYATLRLRGVRRACADGGLGDEALAVEHAEVTAAAGQMAAADLLSRMPRPTALICATDAQALGAMAACRAAGLVVGRDVSVTGYGNTEASAFSEPPLATIEHAIVDNGRHLAQMLLRVMAGDPVASLQQLAPVELLERASMAQAPQPAAVRAPQPGSP